MPFIKKVKDQCLKKFWGDSIVPRGLFELNHYFMIYGPISFKRENGAGEIIALSTNYKYGSIITSGKNEQELEQNIKDAILTSFEVPSSYAKEANIYKIGQTEAYALA
jgi:hypothetical protein